MGRSACVRAVVALLVAGVGAGPSPGQPAGKKYAVLVGINKYDHPQVNPLSYAVADVTALGEVLAAQGFECTLLTDATGAKAEDLKPTRENITFHLRRAAAQCRKPDTLLVALSGHGCQFPNAKDGYLLPADGRPFRDRTDTMVPLSGVYKEFEQSLAGLKVLFVDACRSEPKQTEKGLYLESLPPPRGVAAMFACSNTEVAYEYRKSATGCSCTTSWRASRGRRPGTTGG